MRPLVNELPISDNVLFVFLWFWNYARYKIFRFCNRAHSQSSLSPAILRTLRNAAGYLCRLRALWQDKAFLLRRPRRWPPQLSLCASKWRDKVVAIAHNAKGFDEQFILKRAIFLKWQPKLILNGLKIIRMQIQHLTFIDSVSFLPMPLCKLPEAFGLSVTKFHIFSTLKPILIMLDLSLTWVNSVQMRWGSLKEKNS